MKLTRGRDQKRQTLDGFYTELSEGEDFVGRSCGKAMLSLLKRLRTLPDDRIVFGLTSHDRLCLLAEDAYESPSFVVVSALNDQNYYIEYLIPEQVGPWLHAYVKGEARSEDDAIRMIEIAMTESGGWT